MSFMNSRAPRPRNHGHYRLPTLIRPFDKDPIHDNVARVANENRFTAARQRSADGNSVNERMAVLPFCM